MTALAKLYISKWLQYDAPNDSLRSFFIGIVIDDDDDDDDDDDEDDDNNDVNTYRYKLLLLLLLLLEYTVPFFPQTTPPPQWTEQRIKNGERYFLRGVSFSCHFIPV